ncbi:hypothetical protein FOZ62_004388 [Perkinsus olseni]|uniref:Uncharacterized protein n=1 Tax=Perkinsus olseni TaxID=32597 RepID=A0A7J6REB2_PEROL|nr:hypothetical protein FOZ62_004388 [Perkinsus olseni]
MMTNHGRRTLLTPSTRPMTLGSTRNCSIGISGDACVDGGGSMIGIVNDRLPQYERERTAQCGIHEQDLGGAEQGGFAWLLQKKIKKKSQHVIRYL